jgi:hypothetical protein
MGRWWRKSSRSAEAGIPDTLENLPLAAKSVLVSRCVAVRLTSMRKIRF